MSALFRVRAVDFDRLYREHAPSVYRYAFAVLGNQADAEDVTQQTFLNAYRAIERGTKPRKAENWLLRIAHNEVRRHFRKHGAAVEVEFEDRVGDAAATEDDPRLADVLRALRKLPPNQRAALVMREFEGRSYAEIAGILEISQSALETLLFRARRSLAEELEDAFTCPEAEQALSRSLDGRLPRRESRRLKEHLHECTSCVRFATLQKRQRSLLKGLSIMPIPASLFLVRSEQAAAAGLGGAAAGSGAVAAGGAATGIAAKAAAVAATAAVVAGAGYGVATQVTPPPRETRPSAARTAVVPVDAARRVPVARVVAPKAKPVASPKARAVVKKMVKRAAHAPVVRRPRGVAKGHAAVKTRHRDKFAPGRAKSKPVRTEQRQTSPPKRGKRLGAAKRPERKRTQERQQAKERQRAKVEVSARPQNPDPLPAPDAVPPPPKKKQ